MVFGCLLGFGFGFVGLIVCCLLGFPGGLLAGLLWLFFVVVSFGLWWFDGCYICALRRKCFVVMRSVGLALGVV